MSEETTPQKPRQRLAKSVSSVDPEILAELDRRDKLAEERNVKLAKIIADTLSRQLAETIDTKISEALGSLGGLLGGGDPPDTPAGSNAPAVTTRPPASGGGSAARLLKARQGGGDSGMGAILTQALLQQLTSPQQPQPSTAGTLSKMIEDANAVAELMNRPYNKGRQDALKEVNSFLSLANKAGLSPEESKKRLSQALAPETDE